MKIHARGPSMKFAAKTPQSRREFHCEAHWLSGPQVCDISGYEQSADGPIGIASAADRPVSLGLCDG
jgi:hypothetical protein